MSYLDREDLENFEKYRKSVKQLNVPEGFEKMNKVIMQSSTMLQLLEHSMQQLEAKYEGKDWTKIPLCDYFSLEAWKKIKTALGE